MSLPRFINKQYFLVRISREAQKQRREKIGSILLHANQVFMQRNMQYGEIVKIGSRPYPCPASAAEWLPEAELGDDLLFHHSVEGTMDDRNSDERQRYERFKFLLFQDDQWRYYLVNYNQAYAVVKRDGSIFTTQDWVIGDPYKAPPPEGVSTDDHGRELLQTDSGLVLFANYKPTDNELQQRLQLLEAQSQSLTKSGTTIDEEHMDKAQVEKRRRVNQRLTEVMKEMETISRDMSKSRLLPFRYRYGSERFNRDCNIKLSPDYIVAYHSLNDTSPTIEYKEQTFHLLKTSQIYYVKHLPQESPGQE